MIDRRIKPFLTLFLTLLACCTNTIVPNPCTITNVPNKTIYAKLQESAPQSLIIRNQTSTPVRLVAQRRYRAVELGPSSSIQISFRVVSIESFEKPAGQSYYVRSSAATANRVEEIDRLGLIYGASPKPEIHYRDPDGQEHVIAFDLNNCGANSEWEDTHWTNADHPGLLPSPVVGVPQALCPTR
jgi:hypothetical protein